MKLSGKQAVMIVGIVTGSVCVTILAAIDGPVASAAAAAWFAAMAILFASRNGGAKDAAT